MSMFNLEKLNLTQKIAYNAAFSSFFRILSVFLSFLVIKLITGYLGLSGYGDYGTVIAFVYIFVVLADFGLYSIVLREISKKDANEEKIVNNAFTIRFVVGSLVLISAYFFSFLLPYSNEIRIGILIASFAQCFYNSLQIITALFQKHLVMDKYSIAEVSGRLLYFFSVWFCVKYDLGFFAIIASLALSGFFTMMLMIFYANKFIKIRLQFDFKFWKKIVIKSFPLAVSAVLVLVYFKLDTVMLSVMKGSEDVGIYALAYKIMENLIFFPSVIMGLTMPFMSRFVFEDRDKFNSVFQRTLNFLLIMIFPIVFGIIFLSEKIIYLLSGGEFFASIEVLKILTIALGFIFLGALFSNVIIVLKKQKKLAYIYFIGALFNFFANLIFIPKYSYLGASYTTLFTEFLVTSFMILVIKKELKSLPSFSIFIKSFFAGLLMFLFLSYMPFENIIILTLSGGFFYAIFIYLMGGVSKDDIRKLLEKNI